MESAAANNGGVSVELTRGHLIVRDGASRSAEVEGSADDGSIAEEQRVFQRPCGRALVHCLVRQSSASLVVATEGDRKIQRISLLSAEGDVVSEDAVRDSKDPVEICIHSAAAPVHDADGAAAFASSVRHEDGSSDIDGEGTVR